MPAPLLAVLREICAAARLNLETSDELTALTRWMEHVAKTDLRAALSTSSTEDAGDGRS